MNKEQDEKKIIEEFLKSKEKMNKFIKEDLGSIKSPIRDILKNRGIFF